MVHTSTGDDTLGEDWLDEDHGRRRRRWPVTLVVLLLVAGLAVAGVSTAHLISRSAASVADHVRSGLSLDGPATDPAADTYRAYARTQLASTDAQFDCLDQLWSSESGWRPTAQNPDSTAYGIAQLLDQTWPLVGATKTSDPDTQIDAGLRYIDERYATPCDAWDFWLEHHWY